METTTPTTFDTLVAQVDLMSMQTWVEAASVSIVGIALVFVGIRLVKRVFKFT